MSESATTFVNFQHNVAKEKHCSIKSDTEITRTALLFKVFELSFFPSFLIKSFKNTKTHQYQTDSFLHLYKDP